MKQIFTIAYMLLFFGMNAQVTVHPTNFSLEPKTDSLTLEESAHLHRRTSYGPNLNKITQGTVDGLDVTVDGLFVSTPLNPPLSYHDDEAIVGVGQPWHNAVYPVTDKSATDNARQHSLSAWLVENIMQEQGLQDKMFMFWHNHYSVSERSDIRTNYQYFKLLHDHALGNTKELMKAITINPAMMDFLDNNTNSASGVNENFAREFLELFTVGKSLDLGGGDYSHYTDDMDIPAAAKIFTGWKTIGFRSETIGVPYSQFESGDHDNSSKTLSYHFDNAVIAPAGVLEYENYIDTVFASSQYGKFLCEEIYRFFVNSHIDSVIQDSIISGLQTTLITHNFEIAPVLRQLFKSQHFYDVALRGNLTKSPLDFIMSVYNPTFSEVSFDFDTDYKINYKIFNRIKSEGMDLLNPPSVAGWEPYYLDEIGHRSWVSSIYWTTRNQFINSYVTGGGFSANGNTFKINALTFLDNLSNPLDPHAVIDDMCLIFFPTETDSLNKQFLMNILLDGLPDFEWTIQASEYYADPLNPDTANPIRDRIRETLAALFRMYNFQTF